MSIKTVPGVPFQKVVNALLRQKFGERVTFKQLQAFAEEYGYMPFYIRKDETYRIERGVYRVPNEDEPLSKAGPQSDGEGAEIVTEHGDDLSLEASERPSDGTDAVMTDVQARLQKMTEESSLLSVVPDIRPEFVPFGDYEMVKTVIQSEDFFPIFVTGPSGNGKTMTPEQVCAQLQREFINIDITAETDEDDLIGGFRLKDGATFFELGPAAVAMLRGSVLVLNEIDLGSPKIMCLQRVLEGKPLTIKKLGITIKPKKGFNVIATANTKGRGDERGRYIGTGLLNEAFLERFPITIEQEYPDIDTEEMILKKTYQSVGGTLKSTQVTFCNTLAKWADTIRKTYEKGACEDLVSTRRLCHIIRAYKIFQTTDPATAQDKALTYCLSRFDTKVQASFADIYNKLCPAKPNQPSNVGKKPPTGF